MVSYARQPPLTTLYEQVGDHSCDKAIKLRSEQIQHEEHMMD